MAQVKRLNLEGEEPIIAKWLDEFNSYNTQRSYRTAVRKYKQVLGIDSLEKYLHSNPDLEGDVKKFLAALNGMPSKTVSGYTGALKVFFNDTGYRIPDETWKKIKRRGFMPKRTRAETRDKKPTKAMLKKILNYADLKARSQILFLLSSGARIGETLQLQKEDFDFEADPPRVHIRPEYTKGGVGGRTVFFSYEACDAIKDWLNIKDTLNKRGTSEDFGGPRVFAWNSASARFMWNLACDKAGYRIRDKRTKRRVYHLHSLRKYFRTKIGLDLDIIHALMGHAEYLDKAYVRLDQDKEIADAYLEAMPNVSVYQVEDQELRQETESLREENEKLKRKIEQLEAKSEKINNLEKVLMDLQNDVEKMKKNNS